MTADAQTQLDLTVAPTRPAAVDGVASMSTYQLLDALRGHYIEPRAGTHPGSVFLTEVTAPDRRHRADAVHVGVWASRGYTVDVCELKTSRADFQRELDRPEKAEAWWPHCNSFWIVAPNTRVAPPELLPPGWGLMVPGRARKFKTVVKAVHRPLQPSTALLAALLVSMQTDQANALEKARNEAAGQRRQEVADARRAGALQGDPDAKRRLDELDKFEALLGLKLGEGDWADQVSAFTLAGAVRQVVIERKEARGLGQSLGWFEDELARMLKVVAGCRKALVEGAVPERAA